MPGFLLVLNGAEFRGQEFIVSDCCLAFLAEELLDRFWDNSCRES
jgi:hypothetical protein